MLISTQVYRATALELVHWQKASRLEHESTSMIYGNVTDSCQPTCRFCYEVSHEACQYLECDNRCVSGQKWYECYYTLRGTCMVVEC
jgi:hypothetical protein